MKFFIVVALTSITSYTSGQMVISSSTVVSAASGTTIITSSSIINNSSGTDLSNVALTLKGSTKNVLNTNSPLDVDQLTVDTDGNYTVGGAWTITTALSLTKGNLLTARSSSSKLVYTGSDDLNGSEASYVNGPLFIRSSANQHTFPIGDANGYAPVRLNKVEEQDKDTEFGFDAISADPGFTTSDVVTEIYKDRFWQLFNGNGGTFSGSPISLSSNLTSTSIQESPVILELDQSIAQKNLGGSVATGFFASNDKASSTGKYYAIGKSIDVKLIVHKLITPDNDGKNDVLYIQGIDAYPDNEVTILDRWGVQFYSKKSFKNYPLSSLPQQADVDFTKMAIGNYIVVVNLFGKSESIRQMISVLK
ncbi:MAG: gliding motility-associated C-terminal domain-containing protein [Cyclobacteriaceae bacterium]